MDMFDLFRETDKNENPDDQPTESSPPISAYSSQPETDLNSSDPGLGGIEPETTLPPTAKSTVSDAVVLCVPGALVFRKHSFQLAWLSQLARSVEELRTAGVNVAVVVGESNDAKSAAQAARHLGVAPVEIEQTLRASSQLHASMVLRLLANAHPSACQSIADAANLLQQNTIPVLLGASDSVSTEGKAAMLAERVGARYVLFSDLDIPKNNLSHARFSRMAGEAAFKNNQSFIVDPLTAMILHRSKIESFLLSDKHVSKLTDVLTKGEAVGTWIVSNHSNEKANTNESE